MYGRGEGQGLRTLRDAAWGDVDVTASTGTPALPTGTVTYLLTDIEGSTRLWDAEPEAMADAVTRHYDLLHEVVGSHGGVLPVEQGEGDSIVAAFARAADASIAAIEAQRRLAAEPWATSAPLRVRMALHTGDARLRDDGNYAGGVVIRTARLRAIAHGGQVLVSATTRDLIVDELGDYAQLIDLGQHRLKDLARPERVWQLVHPDLPAEFPATRSLDVVPNNLPIALSSFIGRFEAIDAVARLVLDHRLVTLTGTGGAGKTRLAQQVAAEISEAYPDGVWWVDLAVVEDPALVASAISRAVVLPEDRTDRIAGLVRRLGHRRALLVLDNCEHLLDACAEVVAAVLGACPDVSVLATSRAALDVDGELGWRVPPLEVPTDAATDGGPDEVARFDAVRLFIDRAARVRQDFRLSDADATTVAEICRRLDGIPLAIELAAARTRVLSPQQILEGLGDVLDLLATSARGLLPRQQTIEASIRWSHSLLSEPEQVLLRRLATFAGAFTLEAARAIAPDETLDAVGVLPGLEGLVDQSLVAVDQTGDVPRFRMLETIRQFARRELDAAGEADDLAARHAEWFRARAMDLWPLFTTGMSERLDLADAQFEDLVAMLHHLEVHATPEEHADVAMACLPAISVRHAAEASALGFRVCDRIEELTVLAGRLHLALAVVDPMSPSHVGEGLAAAEATRDPDLMTHARFWSAWQDCQVDPTRTTLAELKAAAAALGEIGEEHFSRAHWAAAGIERPLGHYQEAVRSWERAVAETPCKRCNVMVWSEGALLALERGDLAAARQALERSRVLAVEVRDTAFGAHPRLTAMEIALYAGDPMPTTGLDAELREGMVTQNPMVLGYVTEARAVERLSQGALEEADADLASAIEHLSGLWPHRSEARLRRAAIAQALGDPAAAAERLTELRELAARWDAGPWLLGQIDHRAGSLALDAGEDSDADDLAHRALSHASLEPWPPLVVHALELLAAVAVARDSELEAARLHGAAQRLRDDIGYRLVLAPDGSQIANALASARAALGDEPFDAAVVEGARMSIDEAVAYARRARGERKRPSHGWDGLTPTERQVAELAVAGLTNPEIAERLFVGRETVKTHLSNIYAKVGVANRAQLVADAARRGITP